MEVYGIQLRNCLDSCTHQGVLKVVLVSSSMVDPRFIILVPFRPHVRSGAALP